MDKKCNRKITVWEEAIMQPRVSILIPVYNREKLVKRAIESALSQTYKNIEIIIVDNKSSDNTWEVLKEYAGKDKRIKIFENERNLGPVLNWKKCLEFSTGEYVKFIFSDDWIENNFIEKTFLYLENNEVAFAYTPALIIDENGNENLVYKRYTIDTIFDSKQFLEGSIFSTNFPVSPGCAIFRKKDVEKNLIVDVPNKDNLDFKKFGGGNDLLIYLLTANEYQKVAFVNSTKAYFMAHKGSISSSDLSLYYTWAKLYFLDLIKDEKVKALYKAKRIRKDLNVNVKSILKSKLLGRKLSNSILFTIPFYYRMISVFLPNKAIIFLWKLKRFLTGKKFSIPEFGDEQDVK